MLAMAGKHKGKAMEELVIKEPSYIHWMLRENMSGPMAALKAEAKRLIQKFDGRPYTSACFQCNKPATKLSVYGNNVAPMWWCATCDPYVQGANAGKLQIFSMYREALTHVEIHCDGRVGDYRSLIRDMAKGKGLTRITSTALASFFA